MQTLTENNAIKIRPLHLIFIFAILQFFIAFLTSNSGFSFDEAIWHYIGRNWFRHDLVPYAGGVDNKSPLIYMIYGSSDWLFGVNYWFTRLLGIISQSLGIYFIYRITKHIAGEQAGVISILLYGFSILWKSTGGKTVSLTQAYEITSLIASFYYYLIAKNKKHFFISGLMAGLAFGFRFSAGFSLLVIPLLLFQRKLFSSSIVFLSGALSMVAMLITLFFLMGININELLIYSFSDNFVSGSITDRSFAWKLEEFSNAFFYSELILFYPFIIAYLFIKRKFDIFILWLITSFIGIVIIGMFARTHLKELLPPLSIISSFSINYLLITYKVPVRAVLVVLVLSFFPKTFEPLFGLKKLFVSKNNNPISSCNQPYSENEDWKKEMGLWIKANTLSNDKVFVAGNNPQIQVYSERLSPSIYFNSTQTAIAKKRLFLDLSSDKPAMIVIPLFPKYATLIDAGTRLFINELVGKNYYLDTCLYNYNIYRNGNPVKPPMARGSSP
jgi:4-amino-4-deoxy-L-arabinose transferase-like glycosyltransferase